MLLLSISQCGGVGWFSDVEKVVGIAYSLPQVARLDSTPACSRQRTGENYREASYIIRPSGSNTTLCRITRLLGVTCGRRDARSR